MPLGFEQVDFVVQFEGPIDLFTPNAKRLARRKAVQLKEMVEHFLELQTGALTVGFIVQGNKFVTQGFERLTSLGPFRLAKTFRCMNLLNVFCCSCSPVPLLGLPENQDPRGQET